MIKMLVRQGPDKPEKILSCLNDSDLNADGFRMLAHVADDCDASNSLVWIEAAGEHLDSLDYLVKNIPFPRDQPNKLQSMRWYGDTAKTLLRAWLTSIEADNKG